MAKAKTSKPAKPPKISKAAIASVPVQISVPPPPTAAQQRAKMAAARASLTGKPEYVSGIVQITLVPIGTLEADAWFYPLKVNRRHTYSPPPDPVEPGVQTGIEPAFREDYLDDLIEEHEELQEYPRRQFTLDFYPLLTDAELRDLKKETSERVLRGKQVMVSLIVPEHSLSLQDVVPLIDMGLVPPAPNDHAQLSIANTQDGFAFSYDDGKPALVTTSEILNADLGHLLTSNINGLTAEVHVWNTKDLCERIKSLEASGQAYLTGYGSVPQKASFFESTKERYLQQATVIAQQLKGIRGDAELAKQIAKLAGHSQDCR